MIEAKHVTKRYRDKTAVDHLAFTARPGVITGFLGPNGARKSTTMRMTTTRPLHRQSAHDLRIP